MAAGTAPIVRAHADCHWMDPRFAYCIVPTIPVRIKPINAAAIANLISMPTTYVRAGTMITPPIPTLPIKKPEAMPITMIVINVSTPNPTIT